MLRTRFGNLLLLAMSLRLQRCNARLFLFQLSACETQYAAPHTTRTPKKTKHSFSLAGDFRMPSETGAVSAA